ncbi:hypothetical protein MMC17_005127 [Xylographa soralifera]|nr:hypothetical protein [Xylographa soralifera]
MGMLRPSSLRFIDVINRCVVEAPSDRKYVVLSYVWGQAAMCLLTKSTVATYAQPGSLSRDLIPATIEDAMTVTSALGEQYLWVDSLCIEQDNEADKVIFIPQMATIYGCAEVTIIAAATIDAHAGLPGIRPLTRKVQQNPISLNGVIFMPSLENYTGLFSNSIQDESVRGTSNYNTRGWCFQERLLSARSLIFSEDISPSLELWFVYRVLSFQTDELNAFQGILDLLTEGFGEEFFWALPTTYFEEALKWGPEFPRTPNSQTRNLGTHTQMGWSCRVEQAPFPSWSWIGWIGKNDISAYGSEWTGEHVLVFYCIKNHGRVEKIGKGARRHSQGSAARNDIPSYYDTTRTVITEDHIPSRIIDSPLASVVLCFWTSTALVTARSDRDGRVHFNQGRKTISVKLDASHIAYEPNTTQSKELVLCCRVSVAKFIFCLVCSVDNVVAYREHIVEVQESTWQELQNVWKPVTLG